MSSTQLTHDLYKWLTQLEVISGNHRYKSSGNFELDNKTAESLQSGYALSRLAITLANEKGISINETLLSSMKNSSTSAARTYNWNILQQTFVKIGLSLPKQTQKQIASGNFATLVSFLKRLKSDILIKRIEKPKQNLAAKESQFELKKIKTIQNHEQAESILQLVIFLITQHFGLTAKQAVATLSENGMYFAHMVVKGIKGSHSDIVEFYQKLGQFMSTALFLSEKDPEKNTQFLLQILKPSLISRDVDVTKAGCLALRLFIEESLKYNSKNLVYQILCKDSIGFDFIYMGIKRHPSLINEIFQFLYPLIRFSMRDFFQIQFRTSINSEQQYLISVITLLPAVLSNQQAKVQLLESKTTEFWIQSCNQSLGSTSKVRNQEAKQEIKLYYLQLLCELWKAYCTQLSSEQNEQLLVRVIEQLKKNTRKEAYIVKTTALYRLFDFLDYLAEQKNKLASLIYKKIIFLFVQNHQDTQLRQIILDNFTLILKKFPSIPLQLLLEPFLKQLTSKEGTSYILNMYDIHFVMQVCKHPKMKLEFAVNFLQYFARLYIKSIIFSPMIFKIIQLITDRFCENEVIIEYCLKNTEQNLNLYGVLALGKKKQPREDLIINNQKKSLIIQLLKHYVKLQHRELSNAIKQMVLQLYISWAEDRNYRDKGLESVLHLFGSIEELVLQKQQSIQALDNGNNSIMESHRTQQFSPSIASVRQTKGVNSMPKRQVQSESIPSRLQKSIDFFKDQGLGYKKKSLSKYQRVNLLLRKNTGNPDPRVLQDIQRVKDKAKQEQYRKRIQKEIQQRQIREKFKPSLGYTKLPEYTDNKILFDFDSVKTRHLKENQEYIELQLEEERQQKSANHILAKYSRYTKTIFTKYASASAADKRTQTIGDRSSIGLSFTQIVRMLKDKGMNKIPKMVINEIMAKINYDKRKQRNVLGGIYEEDFGKFLIQLTHVLNVYEKNQKDLPFGLHLQKTIRLLMEGEPLYKEMTDAKVKEYKRLTSLLTQENTQDIPIPEGYRKIKQKDLVLKHAFFLDDTGINDSHVACIEVLDWIFDRAVGTNLVQPCIQILERDSIIVIPKIPRIKRIMPNSTEKNVHTVDLELEEQKPSGTVRKKQIMGKKTQSTKQFSPGINRTLDQAQLQEQKKKEKIRAQHAQKLKIQLERLRQQKAGKETETKKKKGQQQEKQRKKEEVRKKYLEENKLKVQQKKQRELNTKQENSKKQQSKKQQQKQKMKKRQGELLQLQKKRIREQTERRKEKLRQKQSKDLSANKVSNPSLATKILEKLSATKGQQKKDADLKNSIESGGIKAVTDKYQKQFNQLFQAYWQWQKQKLQLNSLALMLRDFNVSPQLILPKHIAQVYKGVGKGQPLDQKGFIQTIARLAYKSDKLAESMKYKRQQAKKEAQQNSDQSYDPEQLIELCRRLKMDEGNYRLVVKVAKQNKF